MTTEAVSQAIAAVHRGDSGCNSLVVQSVSRTP